MFEKKLYTLCAVLSLSCSVYALEGRAGEDNFASSPSMSRFGPSSSATPEQETDKIGVSDDPSPKTLIFKWSHLLKTRGKDSKKGHRARTLLDYLGYLIQENGILPDSERRGDTNRTYELPLLQEELSDNPPRRFRNGFLINPLKGKYGKDSTVSMKISTLIGALPSTKNALAQLSKLTGKPRSLGGDHKTREMSLRRFVFEASYIIEEERQRAAQEKEALVSELERLRAENEELKAQAARSRDIS